MIVEKNAKSNGPSGEGAREIPQNCYPGICNQYFATFAISVATFAGGASSGWVSPMITILETENSPVGKMDILDISKLETLPVIAAFPGTFLFAYLLDRFGRKICGYVAGGINIIGWVFLLIAMSTMHLYIGKFLIGMAAVGLAMLGPIHLSEIAYVHVRGTMMTYTQLAANTGSLLSFLLGTVCGYRLFTGIGLIGPLIFPLVFVWIPESPQFLMSKSKSSEARKALLWYRGGDKRIVEDEMNSFASVIKSDSTFIKVLKDEANRKCVFIIAFMMCFTTMSGTAVINGYASKIFQNADSVLDPNVSAAIMASIKFMASLAIVQLVDRFPRRVLIIFSYISMSVCLVILTIYSYAQEKDVDVSGVNWIPIACLCSYILTVTLGVGTLAEVVAGEMLTPEVKGTALGFLGITAILTILISLQGYALFVKYIGNYFNFLVESLFAISAIFISWRVVPETKDKTLAEISDILKGNAPYINKKTEITRL